MFSLNHEVKGFIVFSWRFYCYQKIF